MYGLCFVDPESDWYYASEPARLFNKQQNVSGYYFDTSYRRKS